MQGPHPSEALLHCVPNMIDSLGKQDPLLNLVEVKSQRRVRASSARRGLKEARIKSASR